MPAPPESRCSACPQPDQSIPLYEVHTADGKAIKRVVCEDCLNREAKAAPWLTCCAYCDRWFEYGDLISYTGVDFCQGCSDKHYDAVAEAEDMRQLAEESKRW